MTFTFPDGRVYRPGPVKTPVAKPADQCPEAREIGRQAAEEFRRLQKAADSKPKINELMKAAESWREKANVHRANLDPEIRELYLRKAAAAEAAAARLGQPENASPVDEDRAPQFERAAGRCDAKATDMSLDPALRSYYRDLARDHRNSAAALRGEPIAGEAEQPASRSVSLTLPR